MQVPAETSKSLSFVFLILLLSALVLSGCGGGPKAASPLTPSSPAATVTISITPSSVMPGQSATISWTSNNATSCTGSGAWSGAQSTSGSLNVVLQGSAAQTYTLFCSGAGLPGQNAATLAVAPGEGGCTVNAAVRTRGGGKRAMLRRKLNGSPS